MKKRTAVFKHKRNLIKKLTKLGIITYSSALYVGQIVFKTTNFELCSRLFVLK